jgi:dihydrofolate synthase/folylpolyglutamate synthase
MNYADATRFLYSLAPRGISLGLDRVEQALAQRGHPERACPAIVVAGTNGKGSVAAMLAACLRASGLCVGLYTSPHLHRMVERFQVDGRAVSERALANKVGELAPWLTAESTPPLTFFEACTVLAFELFRDARCDVMVLEVGLGGRLDATNVVKPLVGVITGIAMDHADRLGPTLAHIAREKAGIIKRGVPVVVGAREPAALRVIKARAARLQAPCLHIDRDFAGELEGERAAVRVRQARHERLRLPLRGAHQADNLACAVAALSLLAERGLIADLPRALRGLSRVRWPGRLELLPGKPDVLLDAAHNPEASERLAAELARLAPAYTKRVLVFGVLSDKDHRAMLAPLRRQVDEVVFTTPPTPRARPARELAGRSGRAVDEPLAALRAARRLAGRRGLVVVAGSIFVMAQVRAHLLGEKSDPPIAM